MAENLAGQLVVELSFDGTKFDRGIASAKRELASFGKATRTSIQMTKDHSWAMSTGRVALNNMKTEYQGMNALLDQYNQRQQSLIESGKQSSTAFKQNERNINNLKAEMYALSQRYSQFQKQLHTENSWATKMGRGFDYVGNKMVGLGRGVKEVGNGLTQLGVIASAAGGYFVKNAIDYESGLVQVRKTTGASAEQMKVFSEQIMQMGRTMPIAVGELENLASIAGQLGVKQDDLARFTQVMAKIGTATSLSSEEASNAIARFTNVTGTGVANIERIGSALVHLGNNSATTETEIMSMASALVGTLNTLGVSEADILGISAALSSLGIAAERGGSAVSKFFVNMASAVSAGGHKLENFAKVAGMTSAEFKALYSQSSSAAFTAFIDGLARIKANGGDVVDVLNGMKIKEVRLRDTLLKLANGSEVLHKSLNLANQAYKEGTALDKEYNEQLNSTKSQWEIAKNNAYLLSVQIGNALLPAINDLINNSDGLVSKVQDFAKWFSNLDDATKKNIVSFGAFALVGGPVLSMFGSLITTGGNLLKMTGTLFTGVGKLSGAFATMLSGDITGGIGMLGAAFNPVVLGVAGVTAALVLGYAAWKTWGEEAWNAYTRAKEFPDISGITQKQAESLRAMREHIQGVSVEIGNIGKGISMDGLATSLSGISEEVRKLSDEKVAKLKENFKALPKDVQEALKESFEATINDIQAKATEAENAVKRIQELQTSGLDPEGVLKPEYQSEVMALSDKVMRYYAESLAENAQQYEQIYASFTKNLSQMTEEELGARFNYIDKALESETALYQKQQDALFAMKKAGKITEEQYNTQMEAVTKAHLARKLALEEENIRATLELYLRKNGKTKEQLMQNEHEYETFLQGVAEATGTTVEQVRKIFEQGPNAEKFAEPIKNLITYSKEMGDAVSSAMVKWNNAMNTFASDKGTTAGNLSTEQLDEFIQKVHTMGLTWNDLQLLSKDAHVDSNVKELIQKILETKTEWDFLTLEEKQAKIKTEGKEQFDALLESLGVTWEQIEPKVQELKTKYYGADLLENALYELGIWQNLTLEQKTAVLKMEVPHDDIQKTIEEMGLWNNEEFRSKYANIDTNAPDAEQQMHNLLVAWGVIPDSDTRTLLTNTNADATLTSVSSLAFYWLTSMLGLSPVEAKTSTNADDTKTKLENLKNAAQNADSEGVDVDTETDAEDTQAKLNRMNDIIGDSRANGANTVNARTETNADETRGKLSGANDQMHATRSNFNQGANAPLSATDYASRVISSVRNYLWSLDGQTAHTYVYTHHQDVGRRLMSGTQYHYGGMAILGDGGKREPFLTPDGRFGVSPDRDTLYNLPIGTKVWPSIGRFMSDASRNKMLARFVDFLPKYAEGTNRSFLDALSTIKMPDNFQDKRDSVADSGNTFVVHLTVNPIGSQLSKSQADSIIEPIVNSINRFARKNGQNFVIKEG